MSQRRDLQLVDHDDSRGSTDSGDLPRNARCPFCGGLDTAPLATFGSLLMTSQYHCRRCRSTFEQVRDEGG